MDYFLQSDLRLKHFEKLKKKPVKLENDDIFHTIVLNEHMKKLEKNVHFFPLEDDLCLEFKN